MLQNKPIKPNPNTIFSNQILIWLLLFTCWSWAQCPTVTNTIQTFCDLQSPTIASLVATDNGGGVAWFATASSTTPLSSSTGLVNGTQYFADNAAGNCGSRVAVTVTIFGPPIGPNFQGFCVENLSQATVANLVAFGNNIRWYNIPVGGTPLNPATVLNPNTLYYASQTNPNTGCETSRLVVFVTVGLVPVPTGAPTQFFCTNPSNPPTVADLVASGNNNWYNTISSAEPLPLNTPLVDGATYYATTVDPPCESTGRLAVTVVIQPLNNAGSDVAIDICVTETATIGTVNLFGLLTGSPFTSGTWTGPSATTNGHLGTVDISGFNPLGSPYVFTYTVDESFECPTASATVTLNIVDPINPGKDAEITICDNNGPLDLFALLGGNPEPGGSWSPALASGTNIFDPSVDAPGTYTYAVTDPVCGVLTAMVTVIVITAPDSGEDGIAEICEDSAPINLFDFLNGTPDVNGSWSPALASGTGIFDPSVDAAGVYTYTVLGTAPCANASATVTVTINPIPNPGTDGSTTVCETDPAFDLFPILGNNPDTGGAWTPALSSGTGIFNPGTDPAGTYTYTIIDPICGDQSATVTVNVNPIPNPGENGSATFCENGAAEDLINYLGGTPDPNGVWSPALASGTGLFDPAVDPAGTYTYSIIDPICGNQSATVTVTINPIPNPGTDGSTTVCETDPAFDLFPILGNNPDAGGTWSPALASGTGLFTPGTDPAGTYTYTIIDPICGNQSATVTVNVNPVPNPGTNGSATFCENGAAEDLINYLGGTPDPNGVWSPALASGTGLFDPTTDLAGTYTYTIIDAICGNQSATVTVTINPIPNPGTKATTTVCETDPAFDLFPLLGNNPDLGGTWSPALASGTGLFTPGTDPAGTYTYTIIDPICGDQSATVTVNVNPIPNPGENGSATFCENGAAEDLINYLGGTPDPNGVWSPALASGTGVFDPTTDPAGIYTYTIVDPICGNQSATVTVTINPIPNPGTNGTTTVCETDPAFDLFPILGNNPDAGGTWSPALASGTGLFTPGTDPAGTYTYTIIDPICGDQSATVTVNVNPIPNPGTNGAATFCENGAAEDLINYLGGTPDPNGVWSPALASGTGLFDPAVDPAGTYTYSIIDPICGNQSATVTVTINPIPNPGTDGSTTVCETDPAFDLFPILGNNPDLGGTWSPALASGTGIFTPGTDPAGTYNYTIIDPICGNQSATVTVNVNPIPNPGDNGTAEFCENGAAEDLINYLGGTPDPNGVWSPALASGTGVFDPTTDPAGTYTYTIIDAICGNQSATVTVTINPIPNPGTNSTTTVCETDPAFDLFPLLGNNPDLGGTWSPALASGTGIFTPGTDPAGTYTYTIIDPICGNQSATVTVNVNPVPNPGTNGSATFCENGAPEDLINYLGGTPDPNGVWTPALASGTGLFDPALDPAGTYSYTIVDAICGNQSATVTVTINSIPNPGTDGTTTVCETDSAFDLFPILGNNPDAGGTWSPALASGTGIFTPGTDPAGTYTYTITDPICGDQSATVTVNVNPVPNPGTNGSATFCENGVAEDLINYLGGTPDLNGVWSPALASGTGVFDPTTDPAGTYTYMIVDAICGNQSATVTVTINPIPNPGTNGTTTVCETDPAFDLFPILGNNPDTGGAWTPALSSGTGIFTPGTDPAGTYTYTIIDPICGDQSATVTVNVNPIPNPGENGSATFCENGAAEDLINYLGGTPDPNGVWSPALASGTGLFDPTTDPAGIYTYTIVDAVCGNQSATVTVTINPIPSPGTNGTTTVCETDPAFDLFPILGNNPDAGGTWSPALASGTGLFTPGTDPAGTYTYTITDPICGDQSATVTVNVNPIPNPGTNGAATFCENGASEDLINYLGGTPDPNGVWSPALASGTGLFDPTTDPAGTYTYTIIDAVCGNQSATVTVTINPIPNPGTNATTTVCETDPAFDLFPILGNNPDAGGTWSPALASGTGIFTPGTDPAGDYTYSITDPICGDQSATVTVNVNPIPNPGTNGSATYCENGAAEDLINYLGGTPDPNGVWTPALASGTGLFDPTTDPAGTYTYTIIDTACGNQSATVTVTITPVSNAGTDGTANFCETDPAFNLFNFLGNNPDAGGTWTPALASGTGIFTPGVDTPGVYIYTLVNAVCGDQSATVTVNDINTISSGVFTGDQTVCNNETAFDLFTLLDGSQTPGGIWIDINNTVVSNPINPSTLPIGQNFFTYTLTNDCGSVSTVVTLTVISGPALDSVDVEFTSPICEGSALTLNLFNLPDGNYTIGYQLTGNNTHADQSATFTSSEGEASFTIPANLLANPGVTQIVFSSLVDTSVNCANTNLNLSFELVITPAPVLNAAEVTAPEVCFGTDVTITIANATSLSNGTYVFNYTINGGNPATGNSGPVTVTDGSTSFTIPAGVFPQAGNFEITINNIQNETNGCGSIGSVVVVNVTILPLPTTTQATVTLVNVCFESDILVNITQGGGLSDGEYLLSYAFTGANNGFDTIPVTFTNGSGSFIILATNLPNPGAHILQIAALTSLTGNACGLNTVTFPETTFTPEVVPTPSLLTNGNQFCEEDNPTVSSLSANITGNDTIVWYDSPQGGNALSPGTLLVNGQTYYAAIISANLCESQVRLEVTVVVESCLPDDILIPDGFSPNNDGINDNFVIRNIRILYPNFSLEIYNRYGNILYQGNTQTPDWDGSTKNGVQIGGNQAPVGVYFFILNFNDGVRKPIQGRLYLSR
jgi:gliding motility-associated-like protein